MLMAVPKYGKVKATQIPEHLPHIAGKDDRGPFRPTAHGAAGAAAAVAARARVIIVSGPSGAGKGTLIEADPSPLPESRGRGLGDHPPRAGRASVDGSDYHFLSPAEFERRVARGRLPRARGRTRATATGPCAPRSTASSAPGRSPLVEIELAGARAVRRDVPEAASIFIMPPSLEELAPAPRAARHRHRGRDRGPPARRAASSSRRWASSTTHRQRATSRRPPDELAAPSPRSPGRRPRG